MKIAQAGMLLFTMGAILFLLAMISKPVEILHAGHFYTDDTPISFEVRVSPASDNRGLDVQAIDETGDEADASHHDLDGANAQVLYDVAWEPLCGGTYTLIATLTDAQGKRLGIDRATIEVLPFRGP